MFKSAAVMRGLGRMMSRVLRAGVVHGIMPAINFGSRRIYAQHRPERFHGQAEALKPVLRDWEKGRRGNNRGDWNRAYFLLSNVEALERDGVPGAFAEVGVYKGNSARLIHRAAPARRFYLFDTFEGFPSEDIAGEAVASVAGDYHGPVATARAHIGEAPSLVYCEGRFPDETAHMVPEGECFAFVHLDCDLHQPTLAALEFFYPRLSPGGLVVVHDYDSGGWPGVTQAVDSFMADKPEGLVRIPDKSGSVAFARVADAEPEVGQGAGTDLETGARPA